MPTKISGSTGVGSAVPSGFLKCNGAEVSRITYAALFTVGSTETRPRNVALLACIFTGVSQ